MIKRKMYSSLVQVAVVIFFIQSLVGALWGLDPKKPVERYTIQKWGIAEGLTSNQIRSITQTPDGYLWIATSKDLVRFDGIKFTTISYIENKDNPQKVTPPDTLYLDRANILRIGSEYGLTAYDYRTGRFETEPIGEKMINDRIRFIGGDTDRNIWITFWTGGAGRFPEGERAKFETLHEMDGKKINAIIEDKKGKILFGSREGGIYIYKCGVFTGSPAKDHETVEVIAMYKDNRGNLWIGAKSGLFMIDDRGAKKFTTADGLSDNHISYIMEDSDKNLWVGTVKGLNRIRKKENDAIKIEVYPQTFVVTCVFEDREKNLWIGTDTEGLIKLKDGKFISYAPMEPYANETLSSLFEDRNGGVWIGTLGGKLFYCPVDGKIEKIEPPELSGIGIASIAEDSQGNLWFGTIDKGIFQKKNKTYTHYTTKDGLADNTVTSIYRDRGNNLWFGTFNGVSVLPFSGGAIKSFKFQDGLTGKKVSGVYEDKSGNIWIATDQGITLLKNTPLRTPSAKVFGPTFLGPPEAILPGVSVVSIYEDFTTPGNKEEVFWIATEGAGLKRMRLSDRGIVSFTKEKGMVTDTIYQVLEDRDGRFWITSDIGVLRVDKNELNSFSMKKTDTISCALFGVSDGMKSIGFENKYSRNSVMKVSNGELWFLTEKGISVMNGELGQEGVSAGVLLKIVLSILALVLLAAGGYYVYKKHTQKAPTNEVEEKKKYPGTPLNPQFVDELIKKLDRLMEVEKVYKDTNLSLEVLAKKLNTTKHVLSRLLNENLGRNFADYVNRYRVEEAKRIMDNPKGKEMKNVYISDEAGFNNTGVFYNAFKKYTGQTPNEYRKKERS